MYSRCIGVYQTQTVSNKNVMVRVCTLCDVNKDEQILTLLEEANVTKIKHADYRIFTLIRRSPCSGL